ncbi:uncharacterized protein ATNIH1004_011766 [Aspergillus tanneri]|uniref:Uncharacterized protein n=1 Tax=Aspergillus tanneri TaxID=1220188 RepID=A0A5M9M7Z7_9EURO|nr:uncharacterized protein ATNIH1004_011766 [Aspergillus tanneri]KAA8641630.1 hypothetical protein ATNIH1004_011766 [Aspergillus tanneri]
MSRNAYRHGLRRCAFTRFLTMTAGHVKLASLFWELKQVLISDATRYYSILLSRAGAGVQEFQMRLFAEQPTATIYSLVLAGHTTVTLVEIKIEVVKLLDTAVSKGFNIGQDPTDNLLGMAEVPSAGENTDVETLKAFFRNLQRLQALVRLL